MRVDVGWERSEPISITVKTPISNVLAVTTHMKIKEGTLQKGSV